MGSKEGAMFDPPSSMDLNNKYEMPDGSIRSTMMHKGLISYQNKISQSVFLAQWRSQDSTG